MVADVWDETLGNEVPRGLADGQCLELILGFCFTNCVLFIEGDSFDQV